MGILRNASGLFLSIILMSGFLVKEVQAQEDERDVIQFSGVVTTMDTTMGILGAHVYVPKTGQGKSTDYYGYFKFALP